MPITLAKISTEEEGVGSHTVGVEIAAELRSTIRRDKTVLVSSKLLRVGRGGGFSAGSTDQGNDELKEGILSAKATMVSDQSTVVLVRGSTRCTECRKPLRIGSSMAKRRKLPPHPQSFVERRWCKRI